METKKKTETTEVKLPDGVTPEMVKAWKERYGETKVKLATLKNEDGDEVLDCVIRVPGRKELSEFEKWIDKSPDKAKDILINTCLLTEKERVKADDDLYFSAFDAISKLLPIRTSVVKNL